MSQGLDRSAVDEAEGDPERPAAQPTRGRPGKPAATIYDIAKLAGVNPSTVSRALGKPGRISAKTEQRVRAAAKQLNYRINPIARALPTGRTRTLGLIVADITNPMFFEVMRGAERAAADAGYTLVLAESQESGEREAEAVERVLPGVDGLVLVTTRLDDAAIQALAARKALVVINRKVPGITTIVPRLAPGIDAALAELKQLGHRFIAYLSGPASSWMSGARWDDLFERAVALGFRIVEIGPNEPSFAGGQRGLARVTASGASAVVAYNDLMAIGLMRAAQEQGTTVPGDLSILGFDDIFGSDFTSPPLTTIRAPLHQMGGLAVRTALSLIATDEEQRAGPDSELEGLATALIVRGSIGPAI